MYSSNNVWEKSTFYVLDAQGNTMVVYEREVNPTNQSVTFTLEEKHIFGSARLGVLNDSLPMLGSQNTTYNQTIWNHTVGKRTYELSNHLGNVLSVISDKVIPEEVTGALVTVMNDQFETTGDLMNWEADDDQIVSNDPLDPNFSLTVSNGEMTIYSGTGSNVGKIYKAQMFEDGVDYTISYNFSSPSNSLAIFGVFDATGNLVYEATTTGYNTHTFTGNGLVGYIGYVVLPQGTVVLDDIQLTYNQPSSIIYLADIRQAQDYSPFGVTLEGRNFAASGADGFRFGFNGMEADDEVKGDGNSYDFGARILDPRLGRWLTIDPMAWKQPSQSTYKAFLNNPISYIDPNGETEYETIVFYDEKGNYLFKTFHKVSDNLMSDGDYDDEDGANISAGYDYRHVTELTVMNDGSIKLKAARKTEIIYNNGIKDYEYFFFAKKKGIIYSCNPEGEGGSQRGGWNLTSNDGGASPTKQRSLSRVQTKNIQGLLDYFSAGNRSLSYKDGQAKEILDDIKSIVEESGLNEKKEKKEKTAESENSRESVKAKESPNDTVIVVQEVEYNESKTKNVVYTPETRKAAESYKGAKYNKTRDTINANKLKW